MKASPEIGIRRIYNTAFAERGRSDVIKWEAIPVGDGEVLTLHFESVASPWRQGVWLRTDRGITINGQTAPSMVLWQDTASAVVLFTCHCTNGFLSFYNVWYSAKTATEMESPSYSSGMLAEELPDGLRYRCNDIGFDTQFQKLVFSIRRTTKCA